MKKIKFTKNQIFKILKEQEAGRIVADLCLESGIH